MITILFEKPASHRRTAQSLLIRGIRILKDLERRKLCRDALRYRDIPIVRGFSGDAPLYRLEGTQGERQSRSNESYEAIVMDEFLPHEASANRKYQNGLKTVLNSLKIFPDLTIAEPN